MKFTAARSADAVTWSPKSGPCAGTKFMTPSGTPASRRILKTVQLDSVAVSEGFQRTTFPISAGEAERFPPMAVKLKGLMLATNPSRPLKTSLFHTRWECRVGCVW